MAKISAWLEAFRPAITGRLAELFMARRLTLIILAAEAERMAFFKRQTHICRWVMAPTQSFIMKAPIISAA